MSRGQATEGWDTVRVANVDGRDRQMIPDGRLCSAGNPDYAGLDLPRADWPATRLPAGASFTFTFRATIPHKGTFRLYVTKDGYVPSKPLTWSDIEAEPFLTVADPPLANGSYAFPGQLPRGKSGRQLIYTIWQNSDTPDTYYSCSDVVFARDGLGKAAPDTAPPDTAAPDANKGPASRPTLIAASPAAEPVDHADAGTSDGQGNVPLAIGGATALVALAFAGGVTVAVIRRRREGS